MVWIERESVVDQNCEGLSSYMILFNRLPNARCAMNELRFEDSQLKNSGLLYLCTYTTDAHFLLFI